MNLVKLTMQPWSDSDDKHPSEIEFYEAEFDRVVIQLHCPERRISVSKRDFTRVLKFLTKEDP